MNKILFFITIVNHTYIEVEPSMKFKSIELLYGKTSLGLIHPQDYQIHLLHMVVQKTYVFHCNNFATILAPLAY